MQSHDPKVKGKGPNAISFNLKILIQNMSSLLLYSSLHISCTQQYFLTSDKPSVLVAHSIICTRHLPNSSMMKRSASSSLLSMCSASSACASKHRHVASSTSCVMKLNGCLHDTKKKGEFLRWINFVACFISQNSCWQSWFWIQWKPYLRFPWWIANLTLIWGKS